MDAADTVSAEHSRGNPRFKTKYHQLLCRRNICLITL